MDNNQELQKSKTPQERVTISRDVAEKIDAWLTGLQNSFRGIKVSRSDLVNWLVQAHSETLTSQEVQEIKDAYFDEVEFTEWALKEMKEARGRGERLALADLFGNSSLVPTKDLSRAPRKRRKQNIPSERLATEESTPPGKEELNAESE